MQDLVSVIIPTYERENNLSLALIKRAIKSVINQTYSFFEVIVVIDGNSDNIRSYLSSNFPEVKIIESSIKIGGAKARNLGINSAKGEWIALLDDDDEWLPEKLFKQVSVMRKFRHKNVVCFCSLYEKNDKILPNYKWNEFDDLSLYLFGRKNLKRIGFIQTSTIFAEKILFQKCLFTEGLIKHQDWDWLLRVNKIPDIQIIHIKTPLSFYHDDVDRDKRVGYVNRWKFTEEWGYNNKDLMTAIGYSFFVINIVMIDMVRDPKLSKSKRFFQVMEKFKSIQYKEKWNIQCLATLVIVLNVLIRE